MMADRLSNTDSADERSSPLPTQEGNLNTGLNNVITLAMTTTFAEREIPDSEGTCQDDLSSVESELDTDSLPALPRLGEGNVSYTSEASSDAEEDWSQIATSDIPELDIALSVNIQPRSPARTTTQDQNFPDSNKENEDDAGYAQPVGMSSGASTTWNAVREYPGMPAIPRQENTMDYEHADEASKDDIHAIVFKGDELSDEEHSDVSLWHEDRTIHSPIEEPNARYEDIGLDRRYFDHDYFLQYYGLAPGSSNVRPDYPDMDDVEAAPAEGETVLKVTKTTNKDAQPDTGPIKDRAANSRSKKKHYFHEDEDAWLNLFFEKLKVVIESGKEIEIPSDAIMYKCFNRFFDGKVLKDADGNALTPRVARYTGVIHKHLKTQRASKIVTLREEVLRMMEDRTGGQLYVPVITDDEIQQYRAGGTCIVDDPDDKTKNQGLALSQKEIKINEIFRASANKKRKQAAQGSPPSCSRQASPRHASSPQQASSSSQASSPEQAPSLKQDLPFRNMSSLNKASFAENAPSSPPSMAHTINDDRALDSDINLRSSTRTDMGFDDGTLPNTDLGVEDPSNPWHSIHIETDPFWRAHLEATMKRKISLGSGQSLRTIWM
ncbi:hypothetical protein SLS60_011659 [Paraconiothyrium brasiliense]|uniref:Uncharacterized protein n=1 Tax=Paraconiothyrium brasiliense TaxID=300254 RepID=A0ABR3QHN8_9PLEO